MELSEGEEGEVNLHFGFKGDRFYFYFSFNSEYVLPALLKFIIGFQVWEDGELRPGWTEKWGDRDVRKVLYH